MPKCKQDLRVIICFLGFSKERVFSLSFTPLYFMNCRGWGTERPSLGRSRSKGGKMDSQAAQWNSPNVVLMKIT